MGSVAQVLLIEGRGGESRSFAPALTSKGFQVTIAKTGCQAEEILNSMRPDVLVLDTSFSSSSGVRICKSVRSAAPRVPLIYIFAAGKIRPPSIRADVSLAQPFTVRKLINRINRLLPSTDGPMLQVGPITLYPNKRSLHRNQRDFRLTPKQAQLVEIFMRNPGQVLSRRELMKKIWRTDFMDDTRTLDVHIRWVREAIEENPSKPRYLITVRGKGYRFSIPADNTLVR